MSEKDNYQESREVAQLKAIVEMQGKSIDRVIDQMQSSIAAQNENTLATKELAGEIRHMAQMHDNLSVIVKENKIATDTRIHSVEKRTSDIELTLKANQGLFDTAKAAKKTVITFIIAAILGLIFYTKK